MDKYYSFLSKALLTEEALDRAGRTNKCALPEIFNKELYEKLSIHSFDENIVNSASKMAIVYTAICSFENTVREFVSKKLLEKFGEDWLNLGVPEKIRERAKTRKEEEDKIKWHTSRGNDNLLTYTEFGDLISIMNQNWELFEPHLISLEWARQIIKSLERSRNVIMHSGELGLEDVERIGTYIRDWIKQVGT
jgi:hypothetical protein